MCATCAHAHQTHTCRSILVSVVIQTRKGQWPLYGGHFNTATSLLQPSILGPWVTGLLRFDCTTHVFNRKFSFLHLPFLKPLGWHVPHVWYRGWRSSFLQWGVVWFDDIVILRWIATCMSIVWMFLSACENVHDHFCIFSTKYLCLEHLYWSFSHRRQRLKMHAQRSSINTTYSYSRCVMCVCVYMSEHASACVCECVQTMLTRSIAS